MSTGPSDRLVELTQSVGIDEPQVLLLRAALLPAPAGVEAWERWMTTVDLQDIDRGSTRLLPLLWHNLLANGVRHPQMPRLKGVYRHTWFGNQGWLTKLGTIRSVLDDSGIELLVLKGAALAHRYYANPGLRPMDDLDVLVRPSDVASAIAALRDAGWSTPIRDPERLLLVVSGTEFTDADGDRLDLHGHVMGAMRDDLDARRWERSVRITASAVTFRALDPTDQLLHVIAHGSRSEEPAIRWVADAVVILDRAGSDIDWDRLVEDTETDWYGLSIHRALLVLRDRLDASIPEEVLATLAARPRSRVQRLDDRLAHRRPMGSAGRLARRWVSYQRWRSAPDPFRASTTFVEYLRLLWDEPSTRSMPAQAVRHVLGRLRVDAARALGVARPGQG